MHGVIGVHVDDLIGGRNAKFQKAIARLKAEPKCGAWKPTKFRFRGRELEQTSDKKAIRVSMSQYVDAMETVAIPKEVRAEPDAPLSPVLHSQYQGCDSTPDGDRCQPGTARSGESPVQPEKYNMNGRSMTKPPGSQTGVKSFRNKQDKFVRCMCKCGGSQCTVVQHSLFMPLVGPGFDLVCARCSVGAQKLCLCECTGCASMTVDTSPEKMNDDGQKDGQQVETDQLVAGAYVKSLKAIAELKGTLNDAGVLAAPAGDRAPAFVLAPTVPMTKGPERGNVTALVKVMTESVIKPTEEMLETRAQRREEKKRENDGYFYDEAPDLDEVEERD